MASGLPWDGLTNISQAADTSPVYLITDPIASFDLNIVNIIRKSHG